MKGTLRTLLIGVIVAPGTAANQGATSGIVEFTPTSYEAGTVGYPDRLLGRAILRNVGTGVLNIQNIRSNCACYTVSIPGKSVRLDGETSPRRVPVISLQPGESVTLEFELTFPKDKTPRNAFFYVLSDDAEERLRIFTVKLSVNKDTSFSIAGLNEIVLQLPKDAAQGYGSLEELNSRFGVIEVQERPPIAGQKRFALRFSENADLEKIAETHLDHPSVSLVFLRASETKVASADEVIPIPSHAPAKSPMPQFVPRKRLTPLSIYWFYSEGCAFCDDVKSLR